MKIALVLKRSVCSSLTAAALICQVAAAAADRTAQATSFVELLATGKFTAANDTFDTTMRGALPEEKLRGVWNGLVARSGPFVKHGATRTERIGAYDVVFVTCEFERAVLDAKVVFDGNGKVAGLFFLPSTTAIVFAPPPYASRDAFDEVDMTFGNGPWVLPGTISLPKGDGPFPAVVLVHGSGPQDRDETIGANKPFRDIAWGLASRGIAVLRYEKRTKQHGQALNPLPLPFTVNEESIDDAITALAAVQKHKGIDPAKSYILGHSLGGMLIPRISERAKQATGFIVLAGTTRPLEDVIIEQSSYLALLDGSTSVEEQKQLDAVQLEVNRIKKLSESDATNPALVFGAPASYWLDLRNYDPVAKAKQITKPVLILQGERDYQVTMSDFNRWRDTFENSATVTLKSYPDLNHLFAKGTGPGAPAEYATPSHVSRQVIDDIAAWIGQH